MNLIIGGIILIAVGLALELLTAGVLSTIGYICVVIGAILLIVGLVLLFTGRGHVTPP
jgi:hypothetical protein